MSDDQDSQWPHKMMKAKLEWEGFSRGWQKEAPGAEEGRHECWASGGVTLAFGFNTLIGYSTGFCCGGGSWPPLLTGKKPIANNCRGKCQESETRQ